MKMIASEFTKIMKEHKLLIAVLAVLVVPIMYAGMFLWAFWDPYEHIEDVPVAVVNEDDGADFEGEQLTLGNELVDNLEEEAAFNFQFVDKQAAMKGLQAQEYYIVIEIPPSFSKNATTVMDETPKQTELIYIPNESYNFLAAQMGETAMLEIEKALEEEITSAYATAMFDKLGELTDGLDEANEATAELDDGAGNLKDGSHDLDDGVKTLASKMLDFKNGMGTAVSGANDLEEGATSLSNGINELYVNSEKLTDASADLSDGSNELASGVKEAKDGIEEINDNLPALQEGTEQLSEGLTQFEQELPGAMSTQIEEKIDEGSASILSGTDELHSGIVDGLENKLRPELSKELTEGLSTGLAEGVADEANQLIKKAPDSISTTVAEEAKELLQDKESEKKAELVDILQKAEVPEDTVQEVENKLDELEPDYTFLETFIQEEIEMILEDVLQDVSITQEQETQLTNMIQEQIEDGIYDGVDTAVNQTVESVDDGFDTYETAIQDGLEGATDGLDEEIQGALSEPIGELQDGVGQLSEGQSLLASGINQLATGAATLEEGSDTLALSQQEYLDNMDTFTNSFSEADTGAETLADGTVSLIAGLDELNDGSTQLSDGTNELADGTSELDEGMGTLLDGTGAFHEEMTKATKKANRIQPTDKTSQMIANPVDVANEKINEVPNYGTGFAPYFLSLGLFVGALLISIVYPLREPATKPKSGGNWFLGKITVLTTVGIIQAVVASAILLYGLGLEVANQPLFYLFATLTSLVFITMIQFLVTAFDNPGRFIAIIILILQLTTSAGTFPLELIPKFLQPFNLLLPMTYSVQGFKAVISSGDFPVMWQNAGILSIYLIISVLLTFGFFIRLYRKQYRSNEEEE